MALTVTHAKNVAIADDPKAAAAGEVLPSDWNANHTISGVISPAQGGRWAETLLANRDYFVATTGSDSNDGLTVGRPFRTIQHAIDIATQTLFFNGFQCIINVADGVYDEFLFCNFYPGAFPTGTINADGPVRIVGTTQANTIIRPTTAFPGLVSEFGVINVVGAVYVFDTLSIDATQVVDANCDCVFALNGATLDLFNITYLGAKGNGTIWDMGGNCRIEIGGSAANFIKGGTGYLGFLFAVEQCLFQFVQGCVLSIDIDPLCTGNLWDVEDSSQMVAFGPILINLAGGLGGVIAGQKFFLANNSSIYMNNTGSGGSAFPHSIDTIPGTTPGVMADNSCSYNGNTDLLTGVTANTTTTVLAGCKIDSITIQNTTANAVTGGINIGTTALGNDVVAAQAVGANALLVIDDENLLKNIFSSSAAQTLFISAVTAWNSASLSISTKFSPVLNG